MQIEARLAFAAGDCIWAALSTPGEAGSCEAGTGGAS